MGHTIVRRQYRGASCPLERLSPERGPSLTGTACILQNAARKCRQNNTVLSLSFYEDRAIAQYVESLGITGAIRAGAIFHSVSAAMAVAENGLLQRLGSDRTQL